MIRILRGIGYILMGIGAIVVIAAAAQYLGFWVGELLP